MLKFYGMLWLALLLAAALFFAAGAFTLTVGVVFGFIAFGMVFMGMIGVLPILASHPAPANIAPRQTQLTAAAPKVSPLVDARTAVHAWSLNR